MSKGSKEIQNLEFPTPKIINFRGKTPLKW